MTSPWDCASEDPPLSHAPPPERGGTGWLGGRIRPIVDMPGPLKVPGGEEWGGKQTLFEGGLLTGQRRKRVPFSSPLSLHLGNEHCLGGPQTMLKEESTAGEGRRGKKGESRGSSPAATTVEWRRARVAAAVGDKMFAAPAIGTSNKGPGAQYKSSPRKHAGVRQDSQPQFLGSLLNPTLTSIRFTTKPSFSSKPSASFQTNTSHPTSSATLSPRDRHPFTPY